MSHIGLFGEPRWWVSFRNKNARRKRNYTERMEFRKKWQRDIFVDGLNQHPDQYDKIRINES